MTNPLRIFGFRGFPNALQMCLRDQCQRKHRHSHLSFLFRLTNNNHRFWAEVYFNDSCWLQPSVKYSKVSGYVRIFDGMDFSICFPDSWRFIIFVRFVWRDGHLMLQPHYMEIWMELVVGGMSVSIRHYWLRTRIYRIVGCSAFFFDVDSPLSSFMFGCVLIWM